MESIQQAAIKMSSSASEPIVSFTSQKRTNIQWTWLRETQLWRLLSNRTTSIIISNSSLSIQGHFLMVLPKLRTKKGQILIAWSILPCCSNTQFKNSSRLRAVLLVAASLWGISIHIFEPSSSQFLNAASNSLNLHQALDRPTWVAVITFRLAIACASRRNSDLKCLTKIIWASSKSTCDTLPKSWQMCQRTPTLLTSAPYRWLSLKTVWACLCFNSRTKRPRLWMMKNGPSRRRKEWL